ncbi:hypothetical protein [Arthrobacter sp. S41]|uniref:hypothetical protein n=1 Tax=Arthrobacter sp. S41 TaxID=2509721 RepID=UPI00103685F1|nr:hypothetical protein [Arthrobacter sp. S41]TAP26835.1 hypothetical protein EYR88_00245 [Arthrobacter sp. S41]
MILTRSQGERLAVIINASRPEWAIPSIAKILQTANQSNGLPAHDFNHAIRAVVAYATATVAGGEYVKQTPGFIHEPSRFWDDTAPTGKGYKSAPRVMCEEHSTYEAHSCSCCWADVNVGERTESQVGKRLHPAHPPNPGKAQAVKQAIKTLQAAQH